MRLCVKLNTDQNTKTITQKTKQPQNIFQTRKIKIVDKCSHTKFPLLLKKECFSQINIKNGWQNDFEVDLHKNAAISLSLELTILPK